MSIHQLMYVSGATRSVTDTDIRAILDSSRRRNAALGITGLLLYGEGAFIQVLEGEREKVLTLTTIIRTDPRHRNYMTMLEHDVKSRAFGQWQMGFKRLDPALQADQTIFSTTRSALESRISPGDGGVMLDTILAFASRDFLATA
jgi:hypothetical protein